MSFYHYRRRIERLEERKNARAFAQKLVFGRFALWIDRLPEGTPIPEGGRVVRDFYTYQEPSPDRRGFIGGHSQERSTTIDGDNGRTVDLTAEPETGEPGDASGG